MNVPASLNHRPVSLIAVHGNGHTSAAGSDAAVEGIIVELSENILKLIHILKSRGFRNITSIKKSMYANLCDAFLLRLFDHCDQVRNVGMYVSVGKKSDKVKLSAVLLQIIHSSLPGIRLIDLSGLNALIDKLRALGINLSAATSILTNLGIAHVIIRRKSDSRSACLDRGVRPLCHQLINLGLIGMHHRISLILVGPADTVHYYQYYRFHK